MPRLMKYSSNKQIADKLKDVPDQYLQAIEYAGFTYLINQYSPSSSKLTQALKSSMVLIAYEFYLLNYNKETITKVKDFMEPN